MKNTEATTRRIVAEYDGTGWLVMWSDGRVEWYPTKRSVVAAIRRSAVARIDIAEVEWRS